MIKRYSDWERLNEVDELTEPKLVGKYINGIIQAYDKFPSARPSRNIDDFANAKSTQPLGTFVKGASGKTSADIIKAVMNDWYKWPEESQAKKILIGYINNDDDLSNLAAWGLPFGKVIQSDPTIALGFGSFGKSAAKTTTKVSKGLFGWVPKLFGIKESVRVNEGAILGFLGKVAAGALLSATTRYALYGKESIEDDPLFSWTTPYLPDIKGIVGDDPILATYVSVFNTMMMIVYDAWNLCMGQEKYGNNPNPILDWKTGNNYISSYYKEFYEQDADIKSNFTSFMDGLKNACMADMKHPSMFKDCPFYYTGDKVRVNFDNGKSESIPLSDWNKWVRDNNKKYALVPITNVEFSASERKGPFTPLSPLGISQEAKGDPMREITVQFPDGSITNLSLLQLEIYLQNSKNVSSYEVESQNITDGGSSLILAAKEGEDVATEKEEGIETSKPPVVKGSNLEEILANLQREEMVSFIGMGNI